MLARTKFFPIFAAWALFSLVLSAAAFGLAPPQIVISLDQHGAPHKALASHAPRLWLQSASFIAEDTDDSLAKVLNGHNRDKAPAIVENRPVATAAAAISLGPPRKAPTSKTPRHLYFSVLNL